MSTVNLFDGYNSLTKEIQHETSLSGEAKPEEITGTDIMCTVISNVEERDKDFEAGFSLNTILPKDAISAEIGISGSVKNTISKKGLYCVLHFTKQEKWQVAYNVRLNSEKNELLQNDCDAFFLQLGDSYVSEIVEGREFTAIVQFHLSEELTKKMLEFKTKAKGTSLAEFETFLKNNVTKKLEDITCTLHCKQDGSEIELPKGVTEWATIKNWIDGVAGQLTKGDFENLPLKQFWYRKKHYASIPGIYPVAKELQSIIHYAEDKLTLINELKEFANECLAYIEQHSKEDSQFKDKKKEESEQLRSCLLALNGMIKQIEESDYSKILDQIGKIKTQGITVEAGKNFTLQSIVDILIGVRKRIGRIYHGEFLIKDFKKRKSNPNSLKLNLPHHILENAGRVIIKLFNENLQLGTKKPGFLGRKSKLKYLQNGDLNNDCNLQTKHEQSESYRLIKLCNPKTHTKNKIFYITTDEPKNSKGDKKEIDENKILVEVQAFAQEEISGSTPRGDSPINRLKQLKEISQEEESKRKSEVEAQTKRKIEVEARIREQREKGLNDEQAQILDQNIKIAKESKSLYTSSLSGAAYLQYMFAITSKHNRLQQFDFLNDVINLIRTHANEKNVVQQNLILIGTFLHFLELLKAERGIFDKNDTTAINTVSDQLEKLISGKKYLNVHENFEQISSRTILENIALESYQNFMNTVIKKDFPNFEKQDDSTKKVEHKSRETDGACQLDSL